MIIKNDYSGHIGPDWNNNQEAPAEVELCDCPEHQEIIHTDVEHVKRDYYWVHYTLVCMNCEMGWIESIYMVAQGRNVVITQGPYVPDEDEDPCICIPDEPNPNCESCF